MMRSLTRDSALAAALAAGALVAIGLVVHHAVSALRATDQWVDHTYEVLDCTASLSAALERGQNATRGFALRGDEGDVQESEDAIARAQAYFGALKRLTADSPLQQRALDSLGSEIEARFAIQRALVAARRAGGVAAAAREAQRQPEQGRMRTIRGLLAGIEAEERRLLVVRRADSGASLHATTVVLSVFYAIMAAVVLGIVYLVRRYVTDRSRVEAQTLALNQELTRRGAELEAANRELESFSYSVSHDLRAPLRAIQGFCRIIQEDYGPVLDPEATRLLGVVRGNASRMAQLIDDLLQFSRLGRRELVQGCIDMHGLVTEVVDELKAAETDRQVVVRVGDLRPARGDTALIRLVVANLVGNALKFTGHRPQAVIDIQCEPEGAENRYVVTDNGAGFDMRYADKLFGVFQRLHLPTEFDGTGVGLAIVQRIVHRHGGQVTARGGVDRGASFSFTLPAWEAP
jgi:signal transduction histidine kinase